MIFVFITYFAVSLVIGQLSRLRALGWGIRAGAALISLYFFVAGFVGLWAWLFGQATQ